MADTPKSKIIRQVHGHSGTVSYGGIVSSEEYNYQLSGVRGYQIYEIMRRSDSTIRQALQVIKLPLRSATKSIKPVQSEDGIITPVDQLKADFVHHNLFVLNDIERFIKNGLTCFDYGFSLFEKLFAPIIYEGVTYIGIIDFATRKQSSIHKWDAGEGVKGVTQIVGAEQYQIPWEKIVNFVNDKEGDSEVGIAILRYVYKDWDMKDKLTLLNAMALEKHGMGMPFVKERDDQTANPGDQAKAEDALRNFRANNESFVFIPKTMEVGMMDMQGQTTKEIIPTINYHDSRIMSSVLARFMELGGASGTGSQSLSADLSSNFMKAEEAFAKEIASTINEQVIKQLIDLNFSDNSSGYPTFEFSNIADDDTQALATSVSSLFSAGALTYDPDLEDNVRERFSLPNVSEKSRERYEKSLEEPVATDETKTTEKKVVIEASATKFSEQTDITKAVETAREVRDNLVDMLTGA